MSDDVHTSQSDASASRNGRCRMDELGRITLPREALALLDAKPGDQVPWRFEDGELKLMSRRAGIRFAQSLVAPLDERHPGSWSRALIAERRAESDREEDYAGG
jgi:bifunctional DNA-binding transcriptional regulator/antitoxin component of YhaV-PrlF toxin-antitoxin module